MSLPYLQHFTSRLFYSIVLAIPLLEAQNWPSFRGPNASGAADRQKLPERWDVSNSKGILWRAPVPGLAHSSPIVWGDRVLVTSAISSLPNADFKHGLYGAGDASPDHSVHQWKLFCFDRRTGKLLWERTAYEGRPKEKRHIKSTYASSTPATDGKVVVALFGSQGLYAYDLEGRALWKKDLGVLRLGAYDAPDYEWGTASSPTLHNGRVYVQCDTQGAGSFVMAIDAANGNTLWKTNREELPTWGTPALYTGKGRPELVTNASNFIRGYDPDTGRELWRLGGSSKITAPTPVFADGLIIVASGRGPEAPIFAIRPGGSGDITGSKQVVWSKQKRGSYMPTPLIYQGSLYVLGNGGIFDCYELATGREVYRQRIPHVGGGFSASPVASDGRIYLPGEDGEIFIVKAGPVFELLGKVEMGERIMATPAISNGMLLVRTQHQLFAIGSRVQ